MQMEQSNPVDFNEKGRAFFSVLTYFDRPSSPDSNGMRNSKVNNKNADRTV
jgi:hypothetical protein